MSIKNVNNQIKLEIRKSKQSKEAGIVPCVSIFWFISELGDEGLINILTPYTEVSQPEELEILTSDYGHYSSWDAVMKVYPKLIGTEYDDFPRGRVNLDVSARPFKAILLASPAILRNPELIHKIKEECNILHLYVVCMSDSHYK